MSILFIDACIRENSRTRRLAEAFLSRQGEEITTVPLADIGLKPLDAERLKTREEALAGNRSHSVLDLAKQFAEAERIVIAAPYWDLSFPALLKEYIENISAVGITFDYTPEGIPFGLCRAKDLTYVTTVGGEGLPDLYGYEYIKSVAQIYYGIRSFRLIKAEGLDIVGRNPEAVLEEAIRALDMAPQ